MDEIAALKFKVLEAFRASTALAALVGDRIYDVPPVSPTELQTPYVRFGPFSSSDDGPECFETYDIVGQVDIYSNGPNEASSTMESLKISGVIKNIINAMLGDEELPDGYTLSDIRYRTKRSITASDGKTKHVPVTFYATVDKN